jgi:NAD(P)-dependent dehydrogenase (short-subunit alcohol dehydrogenase family)
MHLAHNWRAGRTRKYRRPTGIWFRACAARLRRMLGRLWPVAPACAESVLRSKTTNAHGVERLLSRIVITGSADGLGRAAAQTLLADGHQVVVHVRGQQRLGAVQDLLSQGAFPVIGDLSDPQQTKAVADQVNRLGRMDAVIHNAGVYSGRQVLPVNVVAPYVLTALITRPNRLVYLSSRMHLNGRPVLERLDWTGRASSGSYSDSKLFVTTLAA